MMMSKVLTSWPEDESNDDCLLSPVMRGLPVGRASALALLPFQNANESLLRAINQNSRALAAVCAGVFAVDPFVSFTELFRQLARCGLKQVSNWPSVGLYGPPFTDELNVKGLGFDREALFVNQASTQGFRVSATVFSAEQASIMVAAGAERLIFHPPLTDGRIMSPSRALDWVACQAADVGGKAKVALYVEDDPSVPVPVLPWLDTVFLFSG